MSIFIKTDTDEALLAALTLANVNQEPTPEPEEPDVYGYARWPDDDKAKENESSQDQRVKDFDRVVRLTTAGVAPTAAALQVNESKHRSNQQHKQFILNEVVDVFDKVNNGQIHGVATGSQRYNKEELVALANVSIYGGYRFLALEAIEEIKRNQK